MGGGKVGEREEGISRDQYMVQSWVTERISEVGTGEPTLCVKNLSLA